MTEWKTYRLGDVCSRLRSGKGIPASEVSACGKFAVVGGNGVRGYTDKSNFNGQCVVVGRQGAYCGNVRYFDGEFYMTEHAVVIVGNEYADTHFLAYLLSIMELGHLSAQSAQPGLSVQTLSKLEISLPPLEEQRRIAGILGAIDDKIENNRRINTNLELQAQALFEEWMQSCQNKALIKDLADNILDYTPNTNRKVVLLNSSDVTEGLFAELPLVDNVNLKGQFKKRFQKDDILYSEIRPRNKHYAYCYFDSDRYIASTRLIVLRGKKDKIISNTLLYQYIISQNVFEEFTLKTETRSGTFPQGNYQDLSMIEVPFSENQQEIAHSLDVIYEEIWSNYKENETLSTLRDTLLPKLMNGEIKL